MAFSCWKRLLLSGRACRRGGPALRWKRCCHWNAGKSLDPEVRAFLEENTEVTSSGHLTPEIRLRLLTPRCRFWREKPDLWPYGDPFWAIYWPGGQALSRYILDNPCVVKGRSVLDLGSGCGATAIAAVMSGASQVLANDIDPSKPLFSYLCVKIFIVLTVYLTLFPDSLGRILTCIVFPPGKAKVPGERRLLLHEIYLHFHLPVLFVDSVSVPVPHNCY
uniref:Electron transfer flavoprotein beta subunit lysine methyltransferase n=1 Tax=Pavo cristatus TaxID=9049 RepID=A0A8C9FND8_PAVCR